MSVPLVRPTRPHGVLLLLTDSAEDVVAARYAAAYAAEVGARVLGVVVLPAVAPTSDAAVIAAETARRRQEAAAVTARVLPVADAHDVALTAVPLLPPAGRSRWTRWRLRQALRLLVRRSGAELVVVPARHVLGVAPHDVARMVPRGLVARVQQDPAQALVAVGP